MNGVLARPSLPIGASRSCDRQPVGLHVEDLAPIISSTLRRARTQPLSAGVAARFPLDAVADAYRAMDAGAQGNVLVLPGASMESRLTGTPPLDRDG